MEQQTPREERLNAGTHGLGAVLGVVGLALLLYFNSNKTEYSTLSVVVYGVSTITLFLASTIYHSVKTPKLKHYFRILDHMSIYLLIAGTYSPVTLIALKGSLGYPLFWTVWGIALVGIALKLFFTGKYELFSLLLYVAMGWLIVFDYTNLSHAIGDNGVFLLFAGGLAYTGGIVFYAIERIPYNHVIWHGFVLAGALSHFLMIFLFVI
ncbi:PAQR family membrane homeostasis protein TrhA [Mangrovimonas aestuarii]|uniref:PAQR family membrane homeostasis protein TrhA n=1 Tax=Mangrovimonas aestuarii TaxID=3018443 RepID=UPI002377E3E6|nr:hemolysin III family protein [Mangrovimonas aestuarii]